MFDSGSTITLDPLRRRKRESFWRLLMLKVGTQIWSEKRVQVFAQTGQPSTSVLPKSEFGIHDGKVGLLMEKAKGQSVAGARDKYVAKQSPYVPGIVNIK